MEHAFELYIAKHRLLQAHHKVLLAVSGGADSMVMLHLFHHQSYPIAIAHCNFQLRGEDSLKDENMVLQYAHTHHIQVFHTRFDTRAYCQSKGISIEMGARELRYQWFEQICNTHHFDYLATAHHMDDSIETFFLNAARKTGIGGLHGILPVSGRVIHPMLFCTKKEIIAYADKHHIPYREDITNKEDDVQRNFIRLNIIPLFEQLRPDFKQNLNATIQILQQQEIIYRQHISEIKSGLVHASQNALNIDIDQLSSCYPLATYLYECIRDYGFNISQVENIIATLNDKEEKQFFSRTHLLTKTRTTLSVTPLENNAVSNPIFQADSWQALKTIGIQYEIRDFTPDFQFQNQPHTAYFDLDKITFPLSVRYWNKGDYFYPVHGKGKKKLSDYFTNIKLGGQEKKQIRLLVNANNDILWIIAHRSDNRYAVTKNTKKVLILNVI